MLRFLKMEGCGNDFVVVDLRSAAALDPSPLAPAAAQAICDRRFGVGADGVLAILPSDRPGAVARMRVLNADGSEAEMCGNGIRCVARYLAEQAPSPPRSLAIETGAGVLECGVTVEGGRVTGVSVGMGRPRLTPAEIPAQVPGVSGSVVRQEIDLDGRRFRFTAVSMGNPHAVVFVDGDEPLRALAERHGPALERHPWFPKRTNAEFARVRSPTAIDLVVWERGCGITLACGTGACATAVAGALEGRTQARTEVEVALPGGSLGITVGPGLETVTMRGPAEEVFRGEIDLAPLLARHQARPR